MTESDDFNARILKFALQQQETVGKIEQLKRWRAEKMRLHVDPLDAAIADAEKWLKEDETRLRADLLVYMTSTGDTEFHPSVHFRRTKKVMYDREEVLNRARIEGKHEFLREKVELDVRAFEKAVKDGEIDWSEVEIVNAPTIALDKLGDLVIAYEAGMTNGKQEQK